MASSRRKILQREEGGSRGRRLAQIEEEADPMVTGMDDCRSTRGERCPATGGRVIIARALTE
jgi:hypothetical protein